MSIGGGDWMCSACQHMNFKKRDSCQKCGCPKFRGGDMSSYGVNRTEILAGDWYCKAINCGAHNYASRSSCYRCGATKDGYSGYGSAHGGGMAAGGGGGGGGYASDGSDLPGWKAGDWICPRYGCGVHNYACRTECFKCNTPRN